MHFLILNAELRDEIYEDDEVAYTDDLADENEDGLYYDDADADDLADASSDNRIPILIERIEMAVATPLITGCILE